MTCLCTQRAKRSAKIHVQGSGYRTPNHACFILRRSNSKEAHVPFGDIRFKSKSQAPSSLHRLVEWYAKPDMQATHLSPLTPEPSSADGNPESVYHGMSLFLICSNIEFLCRAPSSRLLQLAGPQWSTLLLACWYTSRQSVLVRVR